MRGLEALLAAVDDATDHLEAALAAVHPASAEAEHIRAEARRIGRLLAARRHELLADIVVQRERQSEILRSLGGRRPDRVPMRLLAPRTSRRRESHARRPGHRRARSRRGPPDDDGDGSGPPHGRP